MKNRLRWSALACLLMMLPLLAQGREDLFPRPAAMEPDIAFWVRVYAEVDTDGGLLHDHRNLGVVYEVLRFPEDATPRERRSRVREARQHYEAILRSLATASHDDLDEDARRVLEMWGEDTDRQEFRAAAGRVRFQLGQANRFLEGLVRSGQWLDYIHQTLDEMDLPRELAVLPHVESSFNPDAWSKVGAAGMWQFTRATGQRFMRVDHVVDDRLDPFTSTVAAARLLEHNHSVLGTWPLALTAYNHGSAGMRRAVTAMGTTDIETISRKYDGRAFGFASRNFYLAFVAALEVTERAEELFGRQQLIPPVEYETAQAPAYLPAARLAEILGVDLDLLREHNRGLRPAVWNGAKHIPHGYTLRVPAPALEEPLRTTLSSLDSTMLYARQRPDAQHVVARGDSLSRIAARYNVSLHELASINNLGNRHLIRVGQTLQLPLADEQAGLATLPEDGLYQVRRGDTVSTIARRFGVNERDLVAWNQFDDHNRIYVGQTLHLTPGGQTDGGTIRADYRPQTTPASQTESAADSTDTNDSAEISPREDEAVTPAVSEEREGLVADPSDYAVADNHTIEVQVGETLGHFAHWSGVPARRLRQLNSINFGTPLVVGQRLRLDFSQSTPEEFVARRTAHHRHQQDQFFAEYRITDSVDYRVRNGDSLWTVSRRQRNVPMWLLRQYNPDQDFRSLTPGTALVIPVVERRPEDELAERTDG